MAKRKAASCAALIDEAHGAMATDRARALARLLDAWHTTPATAIADAIEKVGAVAAKGVPVPNGRGDEAREKAWQAAAKTGDPVVRHVLIKSLGEGGRNRFAGRVKALTSYRDPRLAARAIDELENRKFEHPTRNLGGFWTPLYKALIECGDPRTVPRVKALVEAHAKELQGRLHQQEPKAALDRVTKVAMQVAAAAGKPPKLAPAVAKKVSAIVALAGAPTASAAEDEATEKALLAAVYADPADDGPRAIYSDWLLERGDPRGEYIALQLRGKDEWRAYDLYKEHGADWNPLKRYGDAGFERGFPAEISVELPRGEKRAAPDPAWATIHTIEYAIPATDECPMPILRAANKLDAAAFEQLAQLAKTPPLEELGWQSTDNDWSQKHGYSADTRRAIAAFAKLDLPKLRKLVLDGGKLWAREGMRPDQLEWAWRQTPVTELVVSAPVGQLAAWVAIASKSRLQRLEIVDESTYWKIRFELTRDKRGAMSRLAFLSDAFHPPRFPAIGLLSEMLEQMPADQLTSIDLPIHAKTSWNAENRDRFARALDYQRGLETVKANGFVRPKRRAKK